MRALKPVVWYGENDHQNGEVRSGVGIGMYVGREPLSFPS